MKIIIATAVLAAVLTSAPMAVKADSGWSYNRVRRDAAAADMGATCGLWDWLFDRCGWE